MRDWSPSTLRQLVTSRPMVEVYVAHLVVMTVAGIAYIATNALTALLVFVTLISTELVLFHILWLYRLNADTRHPWKHAVFTEVKNILKSIGVVIGIIGISYGIYVVTGFPVMYSILAITAVLVTAFVTTSVHGIVTTVRDTTPSEIDDE